MIDLLPLVLFVVVCLFLMAGYPVALTMAGVSLLFAGLGELAGARHRPGPDPCGP